MDEKKVLKPLNDRVLIKPISEEEYMHGNILVADTGKERPEIGEVLDVGPGRVSEFGHFLKVELKPGDIVLVPKIGSLRVTFEGEEYYFTPFKEILAVVKEVKK